MTTKTAYIRINSGDIGLVKPQGQSAAVNFQQSEPDIGALRERPYIEPWRDRSERDYLARSHPGPSGAERALEDRLWQQISGQSKATAQASPQLAAQWAQFQASRPQPSRKEVELEELLFQQVSEGCTGSHLGGDSRRVAGKAGL